MKEEPDWLFGYLQIKKFESFQCSLTLYILKLLYVALKLNPR